MKPNRKKLCEKVRLHSNNNDNNDNDNDNIFFKNFMSKVHIVVYVFICTLIWKFVSYNVISKLVNISFCQGSPGWMSGSVESSHLPSAVASQIHERHNYQREDTQRKLPK